MPLGNALQEYFDGSSSTIKCLHISHFGNDVTHGLINFSSKDLRKTEIKNEANKMIWVLRKANLIEQVDKKGNLIIYKKTSLE